VFGGPFRFSESLNSTRFAAGSGPGGKDEGVEDTTPAAIYSACGRREPLPRAAAVVSRHLLRPRLASVAPPPGMEWRGVSHACAENLCRPTHRRPPLPRLPPPPHPPLSRCGERGSRRRFKIEGEGDWG
jgi:hypothetical protein